MVARNESAAPWAHTAQTPNSNPVPDRLDGHAGDGRAIVKCQHAFGRHALDANARSPTVPGKMYERDSGTYGAEG